MRFQSFHRSNLIHSYKPPIPTSISMDYIKTENKRDIEIRILQSLFRFVAWNVFLRV